MRPTITTRFMTALCFGAGLALSPAIANDRMASLTPACERAPNDQSQANLRMSANETNVPQSEARSGSQADQGSLSHEFSRSSGVIHPPPSGDHSVVQPPMQGESRMPVIPPPGTPGGNPQVHPK
jgi:hypothetical protein